MQNFIFVISAPCSSTFIVYSSSTPYKLYQSLSPITCSRPGLSVGHYEINETVKAKTKRGLKHLIEMEIV